MVMRIDSRCRKRTGADVTLDYRDVDVVVEGKRLTGGGADVSIEALGTQQTFPPRVAKPETSGDTLPSQRSLRQAPPSPSEIFAAGIGHYSYCCTTLRPGGKKRTAGNIDGGLARSAAASCSHAVYLCIL